MEILYGANSPPTKRGRAISICWSCNSRFKICPKNVFLGKIFVFPLGSAICLVMLYQSRVGKPHYTKFMKAHPRRFYGLLGMCDLTPASHDFIIWYLTATESCLPVLSQFQPKLQKGPGFSSCYGQECRFSGFSGVHLAKKGVC